MSSCKHACLELLVPHSCKLILRGMISCHIVCGPNHHSAVSPAQANHREKRKGRWLKGSFEKRVRIDLPAYQRNPRVRKISVRNSGAGNGRANFMGAWKNCILSAGKPHVHKIPRFRGGYFGFSFGGGGGGSADFIFMGAGIFLSIVAHVCRDPLSCYMCRSRFPQNPGLFQVQQQYRATPAKRPCRTCRP